MIQQRHHAVISVLLINQVDKTVGNYSEQVVITTPSSDGRLARDYEENNNG